MSGLDFSGSFAPKAATLLTIDAGVITVSQVRHTIAAEAGVEDDLATITVDSTIGSGFGGVIILGADTGDTITLKDGTGNIVTGNNADLVLTGDARMVLEYDGTNWIPINNIAQPTEFTVTNWTEDFEIDADAAVVAEVCDFLGTLLIALEKSGIISATVSA